MRGFVECINHYQHVISMFRGSNCLRIPTVSIDSTASCMRAAICYRIIPIECDEGQGTQQNANRSAQCHVTLDIEVIVPKYFHRQLILQSEDC